MQDIISTQCISFKLYISLDSWQRVSMVYIVECILIQNIPQKFVPIIHIILECTPTDLIYT